MSGNIDFEHDLKAMEERLTKKFLEETRGLRVGLLQLLGARSVVLRALIEELDEAQVERVKARAEELAGNNDVKKYVREWFNPSKDA